MTTTGKDGFSYVYQISGFKKLGLGVHKHGVIDVGQHRQE